MINLKKIENSAKFKNPLPMSEEEQEEIKKKEELAKREAKKEEKKEKELQFLLAQMKLDDVISNIKDKNSREYTDSDFPLKIDFSIPVEDIKRLEIDKDFRLLQIDNDSFYIYPKVIEDVFLMYLKNSLNINTNKECEKKEVSEKVIDILCSMIAFCILYSIFLFFIIGAYSSLINNFNITNLIITGVFSFLYLGSLPMTVTEIFKEYAKLFTSYDSSKKKSKILLFGLILSSYFYFITAIPLFIIIWIALRNDSKGTRKGKKDMLLESPFYFEELMRAKKYTVLR